MALICEAPIKASRRRICAYTGYFVSESPDAACTVTPDARKRENLPCIAANMFGESRPAEPVQSFIGIPLTPMEEEEVQEVTRLCAEQWKRHGGIALVVEIDRQAGNFGKRRSGRRRI